MSRSYKKTPICKDNGHSFEKRQSNKNVRKYKKELSNGNLYRKCYNSYNICDYKSYYIYDDKDHMKYHKWKKYYYLK
jgi:protein tyrosine/serine phosphatase